jgi:hypothetical protein
MISLITYSFFAVKILVDQIKKKMKKNKIKKKMKNIMKIQQSYVAEDADC